MNRRSLFKSFLFSPAIAVALEGAPSVALPTADGYRGIVDMALIRLACLMPGEHASDKDYEFCAKFYRPGITDAELAEILRPYYPMTTEPLGYANCLKCGGCLIYLDRYLTKANTHVIQCPAYDPACENNWPWIQAGNEVRRVSARAKWLIDEESACTSKISIAEWDHRNLFKGTYEEERQSASDLQKLKDFFQMKIADCRKELYSLPEFVR